MAKFTVLKYNEFVLNQLGISAKESSYQTYRSNVFFKALSTYYILLSQVAFVVASLMFGYRNSKQFEIVLRVFTVTMGTAQSITMFFTFGKNIAKVHALHATLQRDVDESTKGKIDEE